MQLRTFVFTLAVAGIPLDHDEMIDTLRDRGLGDTIIEQRGAHTFFSFVREAKSPEAALDRAIAEIELGVSVTKVVRIVDELLTIEEIGRRTGMRGAMITTMAETFATSAPAPEGLTQSGTPMWRWSQVRLWLANIGHYVESEVGEPLPPALIYERNLAFERDAHPDDDPVRGLPQREIIVDAESAAAIADAIDEIFSGTGSGASEDPLGDD